MKRIHVVGRKNHGKTTLLVELIRELTARGLSVGAVKHTSHRHEPETPGKDSHRLRQAGAHRTALVTPDLLAVYVSRREDSIDYEELEAVFGTCDLVLVEGHLDSPGAKVEVWRQAAGGPALAQQHKDIVAVVTDDPLEVDVPVWPRRDVALLAERIRAMVANG